MSDTPETATTSCESCSKTITYEPIMIFGRDLAISLHRICQECEEAKEAEIREKEQRDVAEGRHEMLKNTLPPDLLATNVKHPDFNVPLWSFINQWSPTVRENSIGIIGPAAICKTRVLSLLARKIILTRGLRCTWTSAVRIRDCAADRSHKEKSIAIPAREHLRDCMLAPWLFLDDFGKNEWTPAFESQVFQILDHRMNYRLPIAWSANAHPKEYSQVISPKNAWAIIGRLTDRCTIVDLRKETDVA